MMLYQFEKSYMSFINRLHPIITNAIYSDPTNMVFYDKPFGILISLYKKTSDINTGAIANIDFAGNIITIKLPQLLESYGIESMVDCDTDPVATDLLTSIAHEIFHINQEIIYSKYNTDLEYRNYIECCNTAYADNWVINNSIKLNNIIQRIHPNHCCIDLRRINNEAKMLENYKDLYIVKDVDFCIEQKLSLIFNDSMISKFKNIPNYSIRFADGKIIYLKRDGICDCDIVTNGLMDLNKLIYAIHHILFKVDGTLEYINDHINYLIPLDWNELQSNLKNYINQV